MKRRHYRPPTKYTKDELERYRIADVLCDARASLRYARELENGADPTNYGCTPIEYRRNAEQGQSEYRAWRKR